MQIAVLLLIVLTSVMLLKGRHRADTSPAEADRVIALDLPCPWCNAATAEADTACPACGQTFSE